MRFGRWCVFCFCETVKDQNQSMTLQCGQIVPCGHKNPILLGAVSSNSTNDNTMFLNIQKHQNNINCGQFYDCHFSSVKNKQLLLRRSELAVILFLSTRFHSNTVTVLQCMVRSASNGTRAHENKHTIYANICECA